jgi:hypothetical protein
MTFAEILPLLMQGETVKRSNQYRPGHDKQIAILGRVVKRIHDQHAFDERLDMDDFEATDWEMVE